ncbi:MAG TPA: CHAT domain-containing protein [Bacteroidota bacterium]|nr:CHAT domain-containing protein [Bacteroidota bacterium]
MSISKNVLVGFLTLITLYLFGCGKSTEEKQSEADRLAVQVESLINQQKYEAAVPLLHQSIVLNSEVRRDSALGENYYLLGGILRYLGQYDSALSYLNTALDYFRLSGDKKLDRKVKIGLADLHLSLGNYSSALAFSEDAATAAKLLSDLKDTYTALLIQAKANHQAGKYEHEAVVLRELMQIDSLVYNRVNTGMLYSMLLSAQGSMIDHAKTYQVFREWVEYESSQKKLEGFIDAYCQWGRYQQSINRIDSAFHAYSKALSLLETGMDPKYYVNVLVPLGTLAYRANRFQDASRHFADALQYTRQSHQVAMELLLQVMVTASDWKLQSKITNKNHSDLLHRCSTLADTCQMVGFRQGEMIAQFLKARMLEVRNYPFEALNAYQQALELHEEQLMAMDANSLLTDLVHVFMLGEKSDWYDAPLQIQCSADNVRDAFDLIERKNLFDIVRFFSQISIRTTDSKFNDYILELQRQRKGLSLLENEILDELSGAGGQNVDRIEVLRKHFPEQLDKVSSLEKNIKHDIQWIVSMKSVPLENIQEVLPEKTALIEFSLQEEGIFTIVVKKDSEVIKKISIARDRILSLIQEYKQLIGDPRLHGGTTQLNAARAHPRLNDLSHLLYDVLIDPILPFFDGISKLYVVFPEDFGWLPLHTLKSAAGSLIERIPVHYLPTAAVLLFSPQPEKYSSNIVGFGHPGKTDWDVEYELVDIRSFYEKAEMLFNDSATLDKLLTTRYDVLHIAAEFSLDTKIPENSVMVISDGQQPPGSREIPLGELCIVQPPQALIFSNISETPGGMWRYAPLAFLANGSPTVIVTMWQGERKTKKYFGEVFYTSLQSGLFINQAYYQAMVALAKGGEYSQLQRWGLYYLFGR